MVCLLGASLAYVISFRPHNSPVKVDTIIISSTDKENKAERSEELGQVLRTRNGFLANRSQSLHSQPLPSGLQMRK